VSRKVEELEELLAGGDTKAVRNFFSGTSDSERSLYATKAVALCKKAQRKHKDKFKDYAFGSQTYIADCELKSCITAVMVTANDEQLRSIEWPGFAEYSFDFPLIKELKPAGLEDFGDILMDASVNNFRLVNIMVNLGLCKRPISDRYIEAVTLMNKSWLLENLDFIEEGIWRLFEVEGTQESSLAARDKYRHPKDRWSNALVELSNEGVLSRARLLHASLDALGRGFIQFRSGWYSQLHELLHPTIDERIQLVSNYAHLLGSSIPPTVTFAMKALQQIDKHNGLSEDVLRRTLPPVMSARAKSTVIGGISLLEKAVKKNRGFAEDASLICVEGLQHESPDVHAIVFTFLEHYGKQDSARLQSKLAMFADGVSPLVADRLRKFAGDMSVLENLPAKSEILSYSFLESSSEGWPLKQAAGVVPIEDADEFIAKALYCLEHPADLLEVERVMEAVSNLNLLATADFGKRCAPLKSRAKKLCEKVDWSTRARALFADFLLQWLSLDSGKEISLWCPENPSAVYQLMRKRMLEILKRVRNGKFLPLLSSPVYTGCWIDATTLAERHRLWSVAGVEPDEIDQMVALFRLPVTERTSEQVFGERGTKLKEGLEKWEKVVQEQSLADQRYIDVVSKTSERYELERAVDIGDGALFNKMSDYTTIRWAIGMVPVMREAVFSLGVNWGVPLIDYFCASDRDVIAYFEMLTDSGAPLARKAYVLMLVGFLMSEPGISGYARDAAILAIDERRLDPIQFANRVAQFLHSGRDMPKRLAKSLREVSRVSGMHADAVVQVICNSLKGDSKDLHKEASVVLELLLELLVESGAKLDHDGARQYLQSVNTGGKTAKIIKSLLGNS
jgi:hypothetical protein